MAIKKYRIHPDVRLRSPSRPCLQIPAAFYQAGKSVVTTKVQRGPLVKTVGRTIVQLRRLLRMIHSRAPCVGVNTPKDQAEDGIVEESSTAHDCRRSGAASGLRPSSFVMWNTPVEVQFTSAGCLNYPCRTPLVNQD